MKYELGLKARDKITGFTGVIIGYAKYLTGCSQYLLIPPSNDSSKYPEGHWLDENRLIVDESKKLTINTFEDNGACGVAPMY